jgi:hypothetical protein
MYWRSLMSTRHDEDTTVRAGGHPSHRLSFFLDAGAMNGSTKVQSSQANSGCMLSGARRVHPVIVGWSTANRPLLPKPINDNP